MLVRSATCGHPMGRRPIDRLIEQAAYVQWHRLLFARFLLERRLLASSRGWRRSDPARLPRRSRGARTCGRMGSGGALHRPAAAGVFPPDDPAETVSLAPEHARALRQHLLSLDAAIFAADDSLGWTYQFWRAAEKKAVNESQVKIGAAELPAVTQLVHRALHGALPAAQHARRVVGGEGAGCPAGAGAGGGGRGGLAHGLRIAGIRLGLSAFRARGGDVATGSRQLSRLAGACRGNHRARPVLRQRPFPDRGAGGSRRAARHRGETCPRPKPLPPCYATICTGWKSTAAACRSRPSRWRWPRGASAARQTKLPTPHVAWVGRATALAEIRVRRARQWRRGIAAWAWGAARSVRPAPLLGSLIELTGGDLASPTRIARVEEMHCGR